MISFVYFAWQALHVIVPSLCSRSSFTLHVSPPPQKGQLKTVDTFGFAFFGGALAFFRLPIALRALLRAARERSRCAPLASCVRAAVAI